MVLEMEMVNGYGNGDGVRFFIRFRIRVVFKVRIRFVYFFVFSNAQTVYALVLLTLYVHISVVPC